MKTRRMRHLGKSMLAGFAALMMLAQSVTAFACPAEQNVEEVCACGEEGHDECGEVILYDAQFVDEDGNIYPVNSINPRVFCLGHKIVEGYLQNHINNDDGGCTVRTFKSTKCIYCDTIWVGDLISTSRYVKCPH